MGGRGRKAGWRAGLQSGDGRRLWLREETTGEGTHAAVGGEGPSNLSVRGRRRSRRPGVSEQAAPTRQDRRARLRLRHTACQLLSSETIRSDVRRRPRAPSPHRKKVGKTRSKESGEGWQRLTAKRRQA